MSDTRTSYEIQALDQTLEDSTLTEKAKAEMAIKLGNEILTNLEANVIREDASDRFPYGRFYLDISYDSLN